MIPFDPPVEIFLQQWPSGRFEKVACLITAEWPFVRLDDFALKYAEVHGEGHVSNVTKWPRLCLALDYCSDGSTMRWRVVYDRRQIEGDFVLCRLDWTGEVGVSLSLISQGPCKTGAVAASMANQRAKKSNDIK